MPTLNPDPEEYGPARCIGHCQKAGIIQDGRLAYRNALSRGMTPARKRLFKVIPRDTNLEDEIGIVRMRIAELTQMIEEGEAVIQVGCGEDGQGRGVLVSDLLAKEMGILNALTRTQADVNPGQRVKNNINVTLKVEGAGLQIDVDETLDADGVKELPPGQQTVDAVDDDLGDLDGWDP